MINEVEDFCLYIVDLFSEALTKHAKKTAEQTFLDLLREKHSSGEFSPEIRSILETKDFEFLKSVLILLQKEANDENGKDISILANLFLYLEQNNQFLSVEQRATIEAIIEDLEEEEEKTWPANETFSTQYEKLLASHKKRQKFYVEKEVGDFAFCKKLENSPNLKQTLALATPFQIKSALIYFAIKETAFHLTEEFVAMMESLIEAARSRKIDLDFTNGTYSLLTLICKKVQDVYCSPEQKKVIELFLQDNKNPLARVEEKSPHIIPTMNLEVHKLFIAHSSFSIRFDQREMYLARCKSWYPDIHKWLMENKEGEAKNFWK